MGRSNHGEYLTAMDAVSTENACVFRPQNHPPTKYDCLIFKRHDYTTKNVELVSQQIKTNLVPNLISRDVIMSLENQTIIFCYWMVLWSEETDIFIRPSINSS